MINNQFEKQEWILNYLRTEQAQIDILNASFVNAYIKQFKPKYIIQPFGAYKVPELGKLLSIMYQCNLLERYTIGLKNMEAGFPKWIYSYCIN